MSNTSVETIQQFLDENRTKEAKKQERQAGQQSKMMTYLNARTAQVKHGGKLCYIDNTDAKIEFYSKADMRDILADHFIVNKQGDSTPAFNWWLTQKTRTQYSEITFEPDPKKSIGKSLNLFKGNAIKPWAHPTGWKKFGDHLWRNVCQRDQESFDFFLDIVACWYQRPGYRLVH